MLQPCRNPPDDDGHGPLRGELKGVAASGAASTGLHKSKHTAGRSLRVEEGADARSVCSCSPLRGGAGAWRCLESRSTRRRWTCSETPVVILETRRNTAGGLRKQARTRSCVSVTPDRAPLGQNQS